MYCVLISWKWLYYMSDHLSISTHPSTHGGQRTTFSYHFSPLTVSPRDLAQVVRHGGQRLHLLLYLASPSRALRTEDISVGRTGETI